MPILYWPQYSPDDQEKIVTVISPDDDAGGWWSSVGRAGFAIAIAAGASVSSLTQTAITVVQATADEAVSPPKVTVDEQSTMQEILVTYGNRVLQFVGSNDWIGPPTIRVDDISPPVEIVREQSTYIIGPGNWGAGTDDFGRVAIVEDYWENPIPPRRWEIRQEKPWFLPDDPTSPKQPGDGAEQPPEPSVDLRVFIVAPWAWTAGSDEAPRFVLKVVEPEQWIDPNPIALPLGVILPRRPYFFHQDEPTPGVVTVKIVEDEFWKNPRVPFPYWNMWPAPTYQQDDPSGLFVLPVLPCVVSPALMGIVTTSVAFTPTAFAQVVFTDVCGDPLS